MIINAYNLSRLNVEWTLPIVHMQLYPNYKHKPTIKTFLQKLHAHEIRRKKKTRMNKIICKKSKVWIKVLF